MTKSYPVHEARGSDARERPNRQRRSSAKQRSERAKAPKRQTRVGTRAPAINTQTKQQICLNLLNQPEGATVEELQAATGRQQHTVRGFLAGAVKKKLGLTLLSEKPDAGPRRYRITSAV